VSLARATIIDPRILVLDEATSSIGVATEARVQRGCRGCWPAAPHWSSP
jgi:ABC-type multidrug transport system fused ATPase/permease subunit